VLFATNGNWDRQQVDSTLVAIDLDGLFAALARPGEAGDTSRSCRRVASGDPTLECDPAAFIDPRTTVRLATGAGNIAIDRPAGAEGPLRLLVPTRSPTSLTWIDVLPGGEGVTLDCGQTDAQRCDAEHEIRSSDRERFPSEPGRVSVDDQGARFAYVPHLLGGALSLIALDGDRGPELTDVEAEFFRPGPFEDEELLGGFSVAARPCDPLEPPEDSRDCGRPLLYSTHRYFPGLRQFLVAPGLDLILAGREIAMQTINPQVVEARPFLGDLVFEDATGDRLLVVQTTPPGLVRLDTSVGDEGDPVDEVIGVVPLCANPNVVTVADAGPGVEALALVTCASEGRLAVIGLGSFRVLASVPVGEGAYDVVFDAERKQAYVSNTAEDTISIVSLDPRSPLRFREWARIGLGAGSR